MTTPQSKPAPVCLCAMFGGPPRMEPIDWSKMLRKQPSRPDRNDPPLAEAEAPRPRDPRNDGSAC
ncbi:hypothetical protein UFOVP843_1 [uncultured Caudovirales phage]|uniref:Uncharacterized protein n=1 Tax=uncultured Caudovirales phage TaxID=2100421 RepID=A0A6J5PN00_9CAUD|nr:hypothetical protein UFOVP843_1 [uncultured Caudovirales phage]CAB4172437.1 hypothetical protein UFOVP936_18 [uncultured Caudovirales phage]